MSDEVVSKKSFSAKFVWIPLIISLGSIILLIVLKLALSDSFLSWFWIVGISFLVIILSFGVSFISFWLSRVSSRPLERSFRSRESCRDAIEKEVRERFKMPLLDLTESSTSGEGFVWAGEKGSVQEKVYFHTFKIRNGSLERYWFALMNMDDSLSDDVVSFQFPTNEIDLALIKDCANLFCKSPERSNVETATDYDALTGHKRTVTRSTPVVSEIKDPDKVIG